MNSIDRAADLLFPNEGQQTLNVKFFCAGEESVSVDDLADQIIRAENQIRNRSARLVADID